MKDTLNQSKDTQTEVYEEYQKSRNEELEKVTFNVFTLIILNLLICH